MPVMVIRRIGTLGQEIEIRRGCFLNGSPGDIDQWPVVALAQRFLMRTISSVIWRDRHKAISARLIEAEQAVAPDLRDAFGAGDETDDKWTFDLLEIPGGGYRSGDDRNIGCLDAAIGKIDAGRRFRRAADAGQNNIGRSEIVGQMLAIIMAHGEVQRLDAPEIFGIEDMLAADLGTRLGIEILPQGYG